MMKKRRDRGERGKMREKERERGKGDEEVGV